MSAHISLTLPDGEVKRFSLEIDLIRIGRAPDNTISLDDASLSSHHCVISRKGDAFKIEDLDSTNGVELKGQNIETHILAHGDVIKMGEIMLTFEADGEAPLDPAPPAEHEDFLITEPADETTTSPDPATRRVAQAVAVDEDEDADEETPAPRRKVTQAIPVDDDDDADDTGLMQAAPAATPAAAARAAQPGHAPRQSGGGIGGFIVSLLVVVLSLLIGLSIAHYRATGGILPLDLLDQLQK